MSLRAVVAALAAAWLGSAALGGCLVRYVVGPQLTGTCAGACDHYVACRGDADHADAVRQACLSECPGVFGDKDSLMAFESLSCPDTVEYVEGPGHQPPGALPPSTATSSSE